MHSIYSLSSHWDEMIRGMMLDLVVKRDEEILVATGSALPTSGRRRAAAFVPEFTESSEWYGFAGDWDEERRRPLLLNVSRCNSFSGQGRGIFHYCIDSWWISLHSRFRSFLCLSWCNNKIVQELQIMLTMEVITKTDRTSRFLVLKDLKDLIVRLKPYEGILWQGGEE